MHRQKGTPNTPQIIIDKIIEKHNRGIGVWELSKQYRKPYKTIKSMLYREGGKARKKAEGIPPKQCRRDTFSLSLT